MVAPFVPSSFGDIVAAASLVHQIYQALSDSTGSSFEYQCLISELLSFKDVLSHVDSALKATPLCESDRQLIQANIAICCKLLEDFWSRIQRYEVIITGGRWYYIWRKIAWAILKPAEVASFRQKLLQHKSNIDMFLHAVQIGMANSNADERRQDHMSIMFEVKKTQYMLRRQLPADVKYDRENALILIDALGEHIILPMQLCFSPDKLHKTLILLFEGKIGQSHVEQYDYRLSTKDRNWMVQSENWKYIVKKGSVIVMSIIVKKRAEGGKDSSERSICPRCHKTEVGVMLDDGWMQCRRCAKRFTCAGKTIRGPQPPQEENIADFRNVYMVLVKREDEEEDLDIIDDDDIIFRHLLRERLRIADERERRQIADDDVFNTVD